MIWFASLEILLGFGPCLRLCRHSMQFKCTVNSLYWFNWISDANMVHIICRVCHEKEWKTVDCPKSMVAHIFARKVLSAPFEWKNSTDTYNFLFDWTGPWNDRNHWQLGKMWEFSWILSNLFKVKDAKIFCSKKKLLNSNKIKLLLYWRAQERYNFRKPFGGSPHFCLKLF